MSLSRLLPALLGAAAALAADTATPRWSLTEDLETRYETHTNITPADVAQEKMPDWQPTVTVEDGQQVLSLTGDEVRRLTGYFYVGRRVALPERVPPLVKCRLAYQRECTAANRAPGLRLHVFTPEGWDGLSKTAKTAGVKRRHGRNVVLVAAAIAGGRDDTPEWTAWESPNLSPALRRHAGQPVVVAISMAAMHSGATEWAKFKTPELLMEQRTPRIVSRDPKYPPKTQRTLHTDEEVALARSRCQEDGRGRSMCEALARGCAFWLDKSDDEIRAIIPGPDVPRAFNVSTRGCPVHGKKIYGKGTYPWRVPRDKPFTIVCPIGGETYPSNDFWAYYRSGAKDPALLKGKYADDGWGWKSPSGDTYWLVGYACHWYWNKHILPGVRNLSRAYLLTGDVRYAHKAAVMLDRIADVYPGMEYENQSRYGFESGGRYRGKILNHIWETGTVRTLSEAYDNVFDALKDDSPLAGKLGKPLAAVRANVEANLLEEAIDGVLDNAISGNFGMHQCALAMAATVRETGPTSELLDLILRQSGRNSYRSEGVEYAFYNLIYNDGMPYETSPGYCFSWVANFVSLARVLEKAGYDFYEQPKFKAMLDIFLDLVCVGKFTPAIGDAGSLVSGWIGGSVPVYRAGFARYRDVRYAHALKRLGALEGDGFTNYESLFEPNVIEEAKQALAQPAPTPRSRVRDGYGIGILNNDRDTVAVSIYYGFKGGHGHFDRLNFSLFAHGKKMTPDLGYPDFMNALVPGIYSWSKNTVSHNCTVVDRQRQLGNVPGRTEALLDTPGLRFIDVSATGTYPQAEVYRRGLVLVDLTEDSAYLVDLFTVHGGKQHDYSLHGPLGAFSVADGDLSPPQKTGTLAGPDVPYAQFYDDPVLADPKYRDSYGGYRGSGFQHLENVQRLQPGRWWAQWQLEGEKDVGLRLRILDQPGQELFVCDGRVSPTGKRPWVMKYLIARREGEDLQSGYASVLEPHRGEPLVLDAERLPVETDGDRVVYAIRVQRGGGADVIVHQHDPQPLSVPAVGLQTDAALAVVRLTDEGRVVSMHMLNGTHLRAAGHGLVGEGAYTGTVASVDYARRAVRVKVGRDRSLPGNGALAGRPITFSNARRQCFYTVKAIEPADGGYVVTLNEPEIMVGRAQVTGVDEEEGQIRTGTGFAFASIYPGARAVNEARTVSLPVQAVSGGMVKLVEPPRSSDFTDANGDGVTDVWLSDFGPGDAFRIDSVAVLIAR